MSEKKETPKDLKEGQNRGQVRNTDVPQKIEFELKVSKSEGFHYKNAEDVKDLCKFLGIEKLTMNKDGELCIKKYKIVKDCIVVTDPDGHLIRVVGREKFKESYKIITRDSTLWTDEDQKKEDLKKGKEGK